MRMMDLNDRTKILNLLEKNAKLEVKDIAAMTGLAEAAVASEIEAMENEGIICGYHAFVNWEKTEDEEICALIELKVTPERGVGFDRIAEKIYQFPEVESLYLISGGHDFTVLLHKATMREVANFVSSKLAVIDGVTSTATHFMLQRYKDRGIILAERRKDTRQLVTP